MTVKSLEIEISSWIIWVDYEYNHQHPFKKKAEICDTHRRGKGSVIMETDWCGHKLRYVGSHQKVKERGNWFFPTVFRGSAALLTLWFWPSDTDFIFLISRIVKELIFVVLSHQVGGNLSKWPQKTNADIGASKGDAAIINT